MAVNIGNKSKYKVDVNKTITAKQHDELVEHLVDKLKFSKQMRDSQADKFENIDRKIYGYLVLDADDEKRERDNAKGYGVKPTDTVLPLTQVQIDDAITFLIEVLGYDNDLYGAIAPKDKQAIATAFASVMNEHASKFSHLIQLNKFLFDSFKYNFAGLIPEWEQTSGNKIKNGIGAGVETEYGIVYEGNKLTAIDPYNFFYDVSVKPTELHNEGEFFATADVYSEFKIRKMEADGKIFGIDNFIKDNNYNIKYYRVKPIIRADRNSNNSTSWLSMLSADEDSTSAVGIELIKFYIWLQPKKFGLGTSEKQSIYRVTLANGTQVVRIQEMSNAHGLLPIGITMPWEDGFKEDTKSYAEILLPLQTFASAQMNTHQKANRKALYGLTFYNKNVINLDDNYDPIASKIPVNVPPDFDMRKAVVQFRDTPDTANTLRDIAMVAELMQQILPTDILKQVAGLERATQYQAASTVQGANRRNLKIAKIINGQAFSIVKHIQMYNILQYQKSMEILTPEGELIEANVQDFRDTKIEFAISEGLKGLDKLSMIMNIKEVLNSVLQSQQANQQLNVVEIIDYWTSMLGDKTDFSQFKFKSEIDKLTPEQKDLAFQLLQQAMQAQQGVTTPAPATPPNVGGTPQ
ncbi:MAG TPA: hypothetical protein ENJ28_04950 [Gammaproteobacteria bacterium]|nr:hypothetical protein [Gammaproteobacteria bacterium]